MMDACCGGTDLSGSAKHLLFRRSRFPRVSLFERIPRGLASAPLRDDSMQADHLSDIRFDSLPLHPGLIDAIAKRGFDRCTPIQAAALPRALAGLDVAGQAQTGTGKTAAFLVAIFTHLLRYPASADRPGTSLRALVLAPTRELAIQIHRDAEILGQYTGLTLGLSFGGVDYDKQRNTLAEGVDILIGTPGRTIDFYKQHVFDLRHVQVMVLDEADRMFDLGFIKDIRYLLRRLPSPEFRLNMLFSATLSHRVLELAYEHMNEPEKIVVESEFITNSTVRQLMYFPSDEEKIHLLLGLLSRSEGARTMVFVNTKAWVERVARALERGGYRVGEIFVDRSRFDWVNLVIIPVRFGKLLPA